LLYLPLTHTNSKLNIDRPRSSRCSARSPTWAPWSGRSPAGRWPSTWAAKG
jgi:hypothetical protein